MIIRYFFLQLKQTLKMLLKESIGLLAAFIIVGIGLVIVSEATAKEKTVSLLRVGVSVNEEDELSRMAIGFVEDYGAVGSICRFEEVNQSDILPLMERGQLDAAISIPDSFVEAADSGENIPATFYFPAEKQEKSLIFRELIYDALNYIQTSQKTVYTALNVAAKNPENLKLDYYSIGDYLAEKLFFQWGSKNKYFESKVILPFGQYDYFQFYLFVGWLLILLVNLSRITFLYDRPAKAITDYLKHKGVGEKVLDGIRCFTVFSILLVSSGLYYTCLQIIKLFGSRIGMEGLSNTKYPVSTVITMEVCIAYTIVYHLIMWAKQEGSIYLSKIIRYLSLVVILSLILLLLGGLVYRKSAANTSGICADRNSQTSIKLVDRMKNMSTMLDIQIYDSVEQLELDVANEKIDNGFFVTEDRRGNLTVKGIAGMFSFGYPVAEETVYTRIYADQCIDLLLGEADNIYLDSQLAKKQIEKELGNQTIEKSLLMPQIVEVELLEGANKNEHAKGDYKLLSILTITMLIILLTNEYEKVFSPEKKAVSLALRGSRGYIINSLLLIAGSVAAAFTISCLISGFGNIRILLLFPFVIAYIVLTGRFFSEKMLYRQFEGLQLLLWLVIVVFMG